MTTKSTVQTDDAPEWAYQTGDVLEDRYEVVEQIAQGAFGEVHAARDRHQDRRVALKILRGGSEKRDPKAVARMRQEAEILRALDHPNLVDVHDIVEVDGRECLVMELLEGQSLRELIDEGELATVDQARTVAAQILSALEAMHRRGVQHRDLKPDNIILLDSERSGGRRVKLVDFGIAKAREFLDQDHQQTLVQTQDNGFVGTPKYAAPEQAVGDPIDATSDLFSLGLVLTEWFTGEPRIDAEGRRGVVSVLIQPDPIEVSDCPESWQPWLQTMLAKTPEQRYQSAEEALRELPGSVDVEIPDRQERWAAGPAGPTDDYGEAPETVDLDVADTEENQAVGRPGDPDEPTEIRPDPGDSSSPEGRPTPTDPELPSRTGPPRVSEEGGDASDSQRSHTWQQRDDIGFDDETEGVQKSDGGSETSVWLTAASVLFFLFSLALFLYSLYEVLR